MRRIKDERLYPMPRIWQEGYSIILKTKSLSPLVLSNLHSLIFAPLESIWRLLTGVLIVDLVFFVCTSMTLFSGLSFSRTEAYVVMGVLWLYWLIERLFRYPALRFLFAKRIRVQIFRSHIVVGRIPFRKRYERTPQTAFSMVPLPQSSQNIAYQNAGVLSLVIDATRRIKIAEVCDPIQATKIIANANTALILSDERIEHDIDPTRNL